MKDIRSETTYRTMILIFVVFKWNTSNGEYFSILCHLQSSTIYTLSFYFVLFPYLMNHSPPLLSNIKNFIPNPFGTDSSIMNSFQDFVHTVDCYTSNPPLFLSSKSSESDFLWTFTHKYHLSRSSSFRLL